MSNDYNFSTQDLPDYQKESAYLPAGRYDVIVDKAEDRVGKTSGVHYCHLTLKVEEGQYAGRTCFGDLYLFSDKPDTQIRYLGYLKLMLKDLGLTNMRAPEDLIGARVRVNIRPDKTANDPAATRVQSFEPYGAMSNPAPAPAQSNYTRTPAPAQATGRRPWDQK